MSSEHERYLAEEHFKAPVIVENYPKDIKAFYMRLNDDGKTVAAMDVLAPGIGEIIGGAQREERHRHSRREHMIGMGIDPQSTWAGTATYVNTAQCLTQASVLALSV